MLPSATPPNAIAFGTGHVTMRAMMGSGFLLKMAGAVLAWLVLLALGPPVFGFGADLRS